MAWWSRLWAAWLACPMSAAMMLVAGCSTSYGMLSSPGALLCAAATMFCVAAHPSGWRSGRRGLWRKYRAIMSIASW
eukprot:4524012-Prorocentrum_lima.AAC.1